jgi:hypothetical protein
VYQRFRDAYTLWQGSDVDLDACFERGLSQSIAPSAWPGACKTAAISSLRRQAHLHQPHLSLLSPCVHDWRHSRPPAKTNSLARWAGRLRPVAPGMPLATAVSTDRYGFRRPPSPRREQTVYALPRQLQGIREAPPGGLAWQWVADHTPASKATPSPGASSPPASRRAHPPGAHRVPRFDPASGHGSCVWIWRGQERTFPSTRALSAFIRTSAMPPMPAPPSSKRTHQPPCPLLGAAAARRALLESMWPTRMSRISPGGLPARDEHLPVGAQSQWPTSRNSPRLGLWSPGRY